jgi:NADH-quinone oxidoreductase subunit L
MFDWLFVPPGRLYVIGTLLPLAAFVLLLTAGGIRALCRPFRQQGGIGASLYWVFGGDTPVLTGAYIATAFMAASAVVGVTALVMFLNDHTTGAEHASRWAERTDWIRIGSLKSDSPPVWEEKYREWKKQEEANPAREIPEPQTPPTALALEVGYKIDQLTAIVFAMVTVVSTLIFIFSLGYMRDETQAAVPLDEEVKGGKGEGVTETHDGHVTPSPSHPLTPSPHLLPIAHKYSWPRM